MKHTAYRIAACVALGLTCSCQTSELPLDTADITHIRISKWKDTNAVVEIRDRSEINKWFDTFAFGQQRHLTVKHPLPILIDLYEGTNAVFHISCENSMMRFGDWEYTMSRATTRMIQGIITE